MLQLLKDRKCLLLSGYVLEASKEAGSSIQDPGAEQRQLLRGAARGQQLMGTWRWGQDCSVKPPKSWKVFTSILPGRCYPGAAKIS